MEKSRVWVVGKSAYAEGLSRILMRTELFEVVHIALPATDALPLQKVIEPDAVCVVDVAESRVTPDEDVYSYLDIPVIYVSADRQHLTTLLQQYTSTHLSDLLELIVASSQRTQRVD